MNLWTVTVPVVLFVVAADVLIKIRVNRRLPAHEQFSWWVRNYSKMEAKHEEFYPDSALPSLRRYAFLLCCLLGTILLLVAIWESR